MQPMRRIWIGVCCLLLLGCGNKDQVGTSAAAPELAASAAEASPDAAPLPSSQRAIIQTAAISLVVEDAAASLQNIVDLVEARGGYVADQRQWRENGQLRATANLRIPADKLLEALPEIRRGAIRVENESVTGEDVSREFVDLRARLTNLQATETELRGLLGTVRQRSQQASQVLEVYDKLTTVRGEIERIQGKTKYLEQMVAVSTIQLELVPDVLAKPIIEPVWRPVSIAKHAARMLVASLTGLGTVLIWLVVFGVPLAAVYLGIALLGRRLWRLRRRFSPKVG